MKFLRFCTFALLGIIATSCLTITEDYAFKANGSGTMSYTLDMSEMSQLMQLSQSQEGGEGGNQMEQLSMHKFEEALGKVKGVSGIKVEDDKEKFIFKISYNFKDIAALNDALNVVLTSEASGGEKHVYFEQKGNVITRHANANSSLATPDLAEQLGGDDSEMSQNVLEQMKYNLHFSFKKSAEAVYSEGDVELKDAKNVNISSNFKKLTENPNVLGATFVFK